MKNKRNLWYGLAILIVGMVYFSVQAQQKNDAHPANFSGEWESKESISMGGNIVCCYNSGDRMLGKTMKISEQADFLTIEASSAFPGTKPVTSKEKLTFDGKASDIDHGLDRGKTFTVKLSADRRTMTVNSIVRLKVDQKLKYVYLTEVWKLSNDGNSIAVQTKAKSTLYSEERSWKTVFNRVS